MRGDLKKERRIRQRSRGAIPWDERYERRNRPHDYSANTTKQAVHFFLHRCQRG